ncbi:unnamed protein product [Clonostachys rhizophaga]|uniref:Uncharacterized protein n=1 Tax=Clonostachys rhizophaga TaxID=160324 RepID=A0A9N9VMQ3_9HYPO|nr:unnamed protein product [Clonostachys rhizophaga]
MERNIWIRAQIRQLEDVLAGLRTRLSLMNARQSSNDAEFWRIWGREREEYKNSPEGMRLLSNYNSETARRRADQLDLESKIDDVQYQIRLEPLERETFGLFWESKGGYNDLMVRSRMREGGSEMRTSSNGTAFF